MTYTGVHVATVVLNVSSCLQLSNYSSFCNFIRRAGVRSSVVAGTTTVAGLVQ